MGPQAFDFINQIAQRTTRPFSQFVTNHLVEILPELRHRRETSELDHARYATATSLIQSRTTPETLANAFRTVAPYAAKRFPNAAAELIYLYREWVASGRLSEPIPPYADAVAVMDALESSKAMQALHPETRDAVNLLLNAIKRSEPSPNETNEILAAENTPSTVG